MNKLYKINFLACLLVVLTAITAQAQSNKPNSQTQSTTQLSSGQLNLPGNYLLNGKINAVRSYDVYISGKDADDIIAANALRKEVMLSTQYLDGLGRPIQTVVRKGTPQGKDMIQMNVYDQFGRETQSFLPYYSTTATDGSFIRSAFGDQQIRLQNHYGSGEDIFYGLTEFDNAPSGTVRKTMAPGNSWAGAGKGVSLEYFHTTTDHNIRKWTVANSESAIPVTAGDYAVGELTFTVSTDEDGRVSREFKDKEGRVILRQVNGEGTLTDSYQGWLSTQYIYDTRGNLRFVLPPKAVEALRTHSTPWNYSAVDVSELAFKYVYDLRNRMILSDVPGAEPVSTVYDLLDRPVLTQDANQAAMSPGQWTFTKFDERNRPVMVGFIRTNDTRQTLQNAADGWANKDYYVKTIQPCGTAGEIEGHTLVSSEHIDGTTMYKAKDRVIFLPGFKTKDNDHVVVDAGVSVCEDYSYYQGYYDATFPSLKDYGATNSFEMIMVNYYDNYDYATKAFDSSFDPNDDFYDTPQEVSDHRALTPVQYTIVDGLPTVSKVRTLDTDLWLTTNTFYDNRGRVIQVRAENHVGGEDIITTQYDFAGRILHTHNRHINPNATANSITEFVKRYGYDETGRPTTIHQKIGSGSFRHITTMAYNELGEMSTQTLGTDPVVSSNPLETLNYKYNVRGWVKSINGDYVANGTGSHYFGMDLSYDYGFGTTQLGGNVAGVKWRSKSGSRQRAYGFLYDKASRLTDADYNHSINGTTWNRSIAGMADNDFSSSYTYDDNGNILNLTRKGVIAGATYTIDDLDYTYSAHSNQLSRVVEDGTAPNLPDGFSNGNSGTANDYTYDDNGNLTKDENKGIQSISYNVLNLPETVTFTGGRSISYSYDAAGIKLKKTVNDNGAISVTDYVGGFVYENNELQFFGHEEGRVRKNYLGNLVNDFFVKDHLGNTRMTLTEVAEVVEYRATMETDVTPEGVNLKQYEEQLFLNLENTRQSPSNFNTSGEPGIVNDETARLNGAEAARRIGPAKMLAVNAGDVVDMSVKYRHDNNGNYGTSVIKDDMIGALAEVFDNLNGGTASAETALSTLFNGQALAKAYVGGNSTVGRPKAYMTYLLFNQDFEYIDGHFYQVDAISSFGDLQASVNVSEGGYLYVYLSNENAVSFDVHFDDFFITHTKSTILQEDHYYPFGMNIGALSSTAPQAKSNQYKYNGNEEQINFDLNLFDFNARFYDPLLGRFTSVDPLADNLAQIDLTPYQFAWNNPIIFTDPSGLCPECTGTGEENEIDFVNGAMYLYDGSDWIRQDGQVAGAVVTPDGTTGAEPDYSFENFVYGSEFFQGKKVMKHRDGVGPTFLLADMWEKRTWTHPTGIGTYDVDYEGRVTGVTSITGIPPDITPVGRGRSIAKVANRAVKAAKRVNSAKLARGWQGKGTYPGVDNWRNITLGDGKFVVGGLPGQSNYYTTLRGLNRSGLSKNSLFQGLQVSKHPQFGYRGQVGIYRVSGNTPAAFGTTYANPQFGSGGLPQLFIPDYSGLQLIKTIPLK